MRTSQRGKGESDNEFLHQLYTGGELLAAGKVIEAKDYLERAHQMQPKNEKGQNLLGLTYFKLGLFDRASEIYEALVRENPTDPTLRVNLGLVYLKANNLPKAVKEFETATDLAPEHKKSQNYLGLALAQIGEYARAREHFLLAGSDAMAEKMARAMAGEQVVKPAAKAVAKTKAPMEDRPIEVMSEDDTPPPEAQGETIHLEAGQEMSAAEAGYTVPDDAWGAAPADAPTPGAESAQALRSQSWGAQFGLDGGGEAPVEAPPDESLGYGGDEMRLAADEGPGAIPINPSAVAAASTPMEAALAYAEQESPPSIELSGPSELPTIEATPEEVLTEPQAQTPALRLAPEPEPERPVALHSVEAPRESNVVPHPATAARVTQGTAPAPFGGAVAATLLELTPWVRLVGAPLQGPFQLSPEAVAIVVQQEEMFARVNGLLALSGALTFKPETRRQRGRATDKPFGGADQIHRVGGRGVLFLDPAGKQYLPIDLDDEPAYFLESAVMAFEEVIQFENGKVTADWAPDLELVHLKGLGKVLIRMSGPMRSLEVKMDRPAVIPADRLLGWHGSLAPRLTAIGAKETKNARVFVELSGEGHALFN